MLRNYRIPLARIEWVIKSTKTILHHEKEIAHKFQEEISRESWAIRNLLFRGLCRLLWTIASKYNNLTQQHSRLLRDCYKVLHSQRT